MLFDLSGIINSGSNSILIPRPLHSLHAPNGELKEKLRGSKSPMLMPHRAQAFRREYNVSSPSVEAITIPFPTFNADWIDSKNLLLSLFEGINLSITTSMVCFFCLSSLGYENFRRSLDSLLFPTSRFVSSPSNLTLAYPLCVSSSNNFS